MITRAHWMNEAAPGPLRLDRYEPSIADRYPPLELMPLPPLIRRSAWLAGAAVLALWMAFGAGFLFFAGNRFFQDDVVTKRYRPVVHQAVTLPGEKAAEQRPSVEVRP